MKLPRVPANGDTRKTVPKQFNVSPPGENDLYIREFLPNRVHAEDTQGSRDIFNAKFLFYDTIEPEELVKYKFEYVYKNSDIILICVYSWVTILINFLWSTWYFYWKLYQYGLSQVVVNIQQTVWTP